MPGEGDDYPFLLYCKGEIDTYRGMPLAELVPGMRQIGDRGYLLVNTDDAAHLGLDGEGVVDVGCDGLSVAVPVRSSPSVNEGVCLLIGAAESPFTANPCLCRLRRNNE